MSDNKQIDKGIGDVGRENTSKAPVFKDQSLRTLLENPETSGGARIQGTLRTSKRDPRLEDGKTRQLRSEKRPAKTQAAPKKIRARTLHLDQNQLRKNRILIGSEAEQGGMEYKILRTKTYRQFKQHGWNSVGVTSPHPSDGKTTTAINLAYAFARSVQNIVILVDFDFHRPNVHNTLDFSPRHGVIDYLTGEVLLLEVLYRVANTNMFVIPGRVTEGVPVEMMGSSEVSKFHQLLKGMFPKCYIFYDLPPVLMVDDAVIFEDKDCNLVVTSESKTTVDDLHHTMELLSGQEMLGYVLNKSKHGSRIAKYGYSYYGYGNQKPHS